MNELLRYALDEADEQAARMPAEPVGVLMFVIAKDGTVAPLLACEQASVQFVADRMRELMPAENIVQSDASHEPGGDTLEAERVLTDVMRRLRHPPAQ